METSKLPLLTVTIAPVVLPRRSLYAATQRSMFALDTVPLGRRGVAVADPVADDAHVVSRAGGGDDRYTEVAGRGIRAAGEDLVAGKADFLHGVACGWLNTNAVSPAGEAVIPREQDVLGCLEQGVVAAGGIARVVREGEDAALAGRDLLADCERAMATAVEGVSADGDALAAVLTVADDQRPVPRGVADHISGVGQIRAAAGTKADAVAVADVAGGGMGAVIE